MTTIAQIITFILGAGAVLLFVGLVIYLALKAIASLNAGTQHPWEILAEDNDLEFTPDIFNVSERVGEVVGNYRKHHLDLKYKSGPYTDSATHLILVTEATEDAPVSKVEFPAHKSLTSNDLENLIAPSGIPVGLRGKIKTLHNGKEVHYEQAGQETDVEYLQRVFDLASDIVDAYPKVVALGGKSVPALKTIATNEHPLKSIAVELMRSIGRETQERLRGRASGLLCPHCFVYCASHKISLGWQSITFYGCRNCGQSDGFLEFKGSIVAKLDSKATVEQMEKVERDGKLYVNWLAHKELFDFDEVEINQATDEDIERFAVQVGNDTDSVRKPRYKNMSCRISPDCGLSENTRRILEKIFGQVDETRILRQTRAI